MDTHKPLYSIVVPVFRSEQILPELYGRVVRTMENIPASFELILVEDGGGDGCWRIMQKLRRGDTRVRIVTLADNFGQHNALLCGLSFVRGDYAVTIDDDLQNPPEEIPQLINAAQQSENDVIFGIPKEKKQTSIRRLGGYVFGRIIAILFHRIPNLKVSNVMIIKKSIIERILTINSAHPVVPFLALSVTEHISTVFVEHCSRQYGTTTYSWKKLVRLFINSVIYGIVQRPSRTPPYVILEKEV